MNSLRTKGALFFILLLMALGAAACTQSKPNVPTPTLVPLANETFELPTDIPPPSQDTPVPSIETAVPSGEPTLVPPPSEPTLIPPPDATLVPPPSEPTLLPTPTVESSEVVTAVPPAETPAVTTGGCPNPYTVQRGDWMYAIARKCGVSPQALIRANPNINPNFLRAGMVLRVPGGGNPQPPAPAPPQQNPEPGTGGCGGTWTVQAGDTLFSIAQKCESSVGAIMQANNIPAPEYIFPGQVLTIPGE